VDVPALPGRSNHLRAGVLVPLVWDAGLTCIVTLRSSALRQHAGEVSFPGGRPDDSDRDLAHTALREAEEELGIRQARILGELSSMPLYTSDYRLTPFVAEVSAKALDINEAEVAKVLRISLHEVLVGDRIEAVPWQHDSGVSLSPVFVLGDHVMFGATAHTFYELVVLLAPLCGVEVPPLRPGRFTWGDFIPSLA
jgi:8-oxo-dGTP pyrophosphatase MutT (NUDIX family)